MDFVEVLQAHGVKVQKGAGSGEVRICCVFCIERNETEDTRFRLGVNFISGRGHCFNCDWSSTSDAPSRILAKLGNTDKFESSSTEIEEEQEAITLPEGFEYLDPRVDTSWYHRKALQYLKHNREIPDWQIKAKKMGVTIVGRFAYRIIFPVAFDEELVGLVGRDFTNKSKLKYLNSVGPKYLYNCPLKKDIKTIILSEGIFKALKIERVTMHASAALLGHNLTPTHLKQLAYYKKLQRIIVWPDPDTVGIKGAVDVCDKLMSAGYKIYTLDRVPSLQADELDDKTITQKYESRVPYTPAVRERYRMKAAFA